MSLSSTTNTSEGLSWWAILLIIIACILAAVVGVFAIVYLSKKQKKDFTNQENVRLKNEYMDNPT